MKSKLAPSAVRWETARRQKRAPGMESKLTLSAVVVLSALVGCGSPNRGNETSVTGGNTSTGGSLASGGSGGGLGGAGSGGIVGSGGTLGQGGSSAVGSGGTTSATGVGGGSGGSGVGGGAGGGSAGTGGSNGPDAAAGGRTATGGSTASGGSTAAGGSTASGGRTGSGGTTSSGGISGSGGTTASGGATGSGGATNTGKQGPCDIYQAASTPCVAAHSTVRALYGAYIGNLYQVRKSSGTKDIPVGTDGYVDISVQDSFCPSGTTCTISIIYDQSPNKNDLVKSGVALWLKNGGNEANAADAKITVSGHVAHGIYVDNDGSTAKDVGYRNNATKGMATGDQPESMYMVLDGKRYSTICCFDYGNAETTNSDAGSATMEAIYWGASTQWTRGGGNGPWVAADLENGMFEGDSTNAPSNTSVNYAYVTAMLKGPSGNAMGLKAGNAQSGALETKWNGKRPPGYSPMKKQGSIILGTGGDGSDFGKGTFFEGCITNGSPPDATDDAVQANIVAAGYGK